MKTCKLVVLSRKGFDKKAKKSVIMGPLKNKKIIFIKNKHINVSSTSIRKHLYMEAIKLKDIIEKALDVNKARDVVVIDLKRKTYRRLYDYRFGTSSRHIQSLSEIIVRKLEEFGILNCKVEVKIVALEAG